MAQTVASAVAEFLDASSTGVIELGEFAPELFANRRPAVDAALERAARATVLVVATPTYKATYTGLLKAFLDLYAGSGLAGVTAIPVQLAADPAHLLAAEVHLRPLLVELGASVPTRAVAVPESRLETLDELISTWLRSAGPALARQAGLE